MRPNTCVRMFRETGGNVHCWLWANNQPLQLFIGTVVLITDDSLVEQHELLNYDACASQTQRELAGFHQDAPALESDGLVSTLARCTADAIPLVLL